MLNIVFIDRLTFPLGQASTKRHRYMMDFLVSCDDVRVSHFCTWPNPKFANESEGIYNNVIKYKHTLRKSPYKIYKEVRKWLINTRCTEDNIVIFSTTLHIEQFPIFYLAKKLGYKIIFDVVENYDSKELKVDKVKLYTHKITKFFYKNANGFIVISSLLKELFSKYQKPISLIPNSTPLKSINLKEAFSKPFNVVYAGTFAHKDGVSYLIKGFDDFVHKHNFESNLILIGRGKTDKESEEIISSNPHILRTGFVSDEELDSLLSRADVLAMTRCNSQFANYGFPFKLSEYLATGNTVIATNVGDVENYLTDRENAYIVEPNSHLAISDILYHIYSHEKEAVSVGKKGQEVVSKHFSIKGNGHKLYEFILQVCKNN